jgi:hypothetical protein
MLPRQLVLMAREDAADTVAAAAAAVGMQNYCGGVD